MKFVFFRKILFLITLISSFSFFSYKSGQCTNSIVNKKNEKLCNNLSFFRKVNGYFDRGIYGANLALKNFKRLGHFSLTNRIINNWEKKRDRFADLGPGFTFYYDKNSRPSAGYILLAFSDPKKNGYPSVEIWDLNSQQLIHEYKFNYEEFKSYMGHSLQIASPLLLDDGSIIFNTTRGALLKADKCGNIIKSNKETFFHHSIEEDIHGNIYIPTQVRSHNSDEKRNDFMEDKITIIDQELNIKNTISLIDIYKNNDLFKDIYSKEITPKDPFHLNDIQPFINNQNDTLVLISNRTDSKVMAIDLNKKKIIWLLDRITAGQHDIDIIDQQKDLIKISIFDNNMLMYKNPSTEGNIYLELSNLPTVFDKETIFITPNKANQSYEIKQEKFLWLEEKLRPITKYQGQSEFIKANNSVLIEENGQGRIFEYDIEKKEIIWEFINKKDKNSPIFFTNWSRRLESLPGELKAEDFRFCL